MTDSLPICQPCGCPYGEGHRCDPPFFRVQKYAYFERQEEA